MKETGATRAPDARAMHARFFLARAVARYGPDAAIAALRTRVEGRVATVRWGPIAADAPIARILSSASSRA